MRKKGHTQKQEFKVILPAVVGFSKQVHFFSKKQAAELYAVSQCLEHERPVHIQRANMKLSLNKATAWHTYRVYVYNPTVGQVYREMAGPDGATMVANPALLGD